MGFKKRGWKPRADFCCFIAVIILRRQTVLLLQGITILVGSQSILFLPLEINQWTPFSFNKTCLCRQELLREISTAPGIQNHCRIFAMLDRNSTVESAAPPRRCRAPPRTLLTHEASPRRSTEQIHSLVSWPNGRALLSGSADEKSLLCCLAKILGSIPREIDNILL